MDWATSATVTGPGKSFTAPSGSFIFSLTSSRPRSDQGAHRHRELTGLCRHARGFFRLRLGQRKIIGALAGIEEALENAPGTRVDQSGLDERLVNRRANARVLHEVPAVDQQDRARRIEGGVVGAIDRKVVSASPQLGLGGFQRIGGLAQPMLNRLDSRLCVSQAAIPSRSISRCNGNTEYRPASHSVVGTTSGLSSTS